MGQKPPGGTEGAGFTGILLKLFFPLAALALWEYISGRRIVNPAILPPPSGIFFAFTALLSNGQIARHLGASALRVLPGFLFGTVSALILGTLIGLFRKIDQATGLVINVLRPIPMIALIPVFILSLGIGEGSKIAVITLGAFWPVLMNTVYGIKNTDRKLLELAYALKKSRGATLFRIVLPSALPPVFVGIRLAAGNAWACVVAAEMIAASSGVGFLIMYAREVTQTGVMFMGVLLIGIFGLIIDTAIAALERRVLRWNYPERPGKKKGPA
jgi:sulfonate transport system permease protein